MPRRKECPGQLLLPLTYRSMRSFVTMKPKHTRSECYQVALLREMRAVRKGLGLPGPGTKAEKLLEEARAHDC